MPEFFGGPLSIVEKLFGCNAEVFADIIKPAEGGQRLPGFNFIDIAGALPDGIA